MTCEPKSEFNKSNGIVEICISWFEILCFNFPVTRSLFFLQYDDISLSVSRKKGQVQSSGV